MEARSGMNNQDDYTDLLSETARRAIRYVQQVKARRVFPSQEALAELERLGGPLPQRPENALSIVKLLDEVGSPATVSTNGGRYFGFVTRGALPVTIAAHWLADSWDQNGSLYALSPVAAYLEEIALAWLVDLFRLPRE